MYQRVAPGITKDPDGLRLVRRESARCLDWLEEVVVSRHYREAAVRLNAVIILVDERLLDLGERPGRQPSSSR